MTGTSDSLHELTDSLQRTQQLGVQLLPTPSELHRAEHGGCGYTGPRPINRARRENALETLRQSENLDPKTRAELRGADRQLMRILLFLQVGDRTQQKTEALRATLQELSDNLLRAEKEAPDLQVNITSFDKNLLPQDDGDDDGTMSLDDIDALFNYPLFVEAPQDRCGYPRQWTNLIGQLHLRPPHAVCRRPPRSASSCAMICPPYPFQHRHRLAAKHG